MERRCPGRELPGERVLAPFVAMPGATSSFLVTASKALVTSSVALVTSSVALVTSSVALVAFLLRFVAISGVPFAASSCS